jgi:hypothetical protein
VPNNPPPKAPGYVDGDKRKGRIGEGRTLNEIAREASGGKHATMRGLLAGVRKLVGGKG